MARTQKKELFEYCTAFVNERIERIHSNITDVQSSLGAETKSSAGDKHETGRAMLQLEREKLGQQLAEAEKMRQTLLKVPLKAHSRHIGLGSLVITSTARYFLAISAGEYKKGSVPTYCISSATPIGRLLLGKSINDTIHFKASEIKILEII